MVRRGDGTTEDEIDLRLEVVGVQVCDRRQRQRPVGRRNLEDVDSSDLTRLEALV